MFTFFNMKLLRLVIMNTVHTCRIQNEAPGRLEWNLNSPFANIIFTQKWPSSLSGQKAAKRLSVTGHNSLVIVNGLLRVREKFKQSLKCSARQFRVWALREDIFDYHICIHGPHPRNSGKLCGFSCRPWILDFLHFLLQRIIKCIFTSTQHEFPCPFTLYLSNKRIFVWVYVWTYK